jgi:hypothetical protein
MPTEFNLLTKSRGKTTMIKTSNTLQDLRRKIYVKSKADKLHQGFGWKQWSTKGLYAMYNTYSNFNASPRKFAPT